MTHNLNVTRAVAWGFVEVPTGRTQADAARRIDLVKKIRKELLPWRERLSVRADSNDGYPTNHYAIQVGPAEPRWYMPNLTLQQACHRILREIAELEQEVTQHGNV